MKTITYSRIEIYKENLEEIIRSPELLENLKIGLNEGIFYKIPHEISINKLKEFRKLHTEKIEIDNIKYIPRTKNCKNYLQKHWDHPNQQVKAKFISWSYFPWNEESHEIFHELRNIFILRNQLANLSDSKYLMEQDEKACARVALQFYPKNIGYMHQHQDPYHSHQYAVPTVMLSEIGKDYYSGGLFAVDKNNKKIYLDKETKFGDLTLFHTSIPHGVDVIDSDVRQDSEINIDNGRLMLIAAVNGYQGSEKEYEARQTNYG